MKRNIITIDREKCTGCGACIPNCPEGAIQIIDNKARLISDLFCDGLGACLGHCPEGAITIEQREAQDYSEREVMKNIIKQGPNVIKAHISHLKDHHQDAYALEAETFLKENGMEIALNKSETSEPCGCPGARARTINKPETENETSDRPQPSQLRQWPIQLHLVAPTAAYFRGADVLLSADCVAYSLGDFHSKWLKGRSIAIACPKLDEGKDVYLEKLIALIDKAAINTLTVMTMEVPCCGGLLRLAQEAVLKASRKIPIKSVVVGIEGAILSEQWV
jgi:ferredoxin